MKLFYRGVSYNYNPAQARQGNTGRPTRSAQAAQIPQTLIYRGVTYRTDASTPQVAQNLPTSYDLIYRGATYHIDRLPQNQGAIATTTVKVPHALPRHYVSKVHQANIQENLQRRLEVAMAREDYHLVKLLQEEQQQIAA